MYVPEYKLYDCVDHQFQKAIDVDLGLLDIALLLRSTIKND
jgi:hypothetical protein